MQNFTLHQNRHVLFNALFNWGNADTISFGACTASERGVKDFFTSIDLTKPTNPNNSNNPDNSNKNGTLPFKKHAAAEDYVTKCLGEKIWIDFLANDNGMVNSSQIDYSTIDFETFPYAADI